MKRRAFPYALMALVVLGGGVAWLECGGTTCGDMKVEGDEQCDTGAMNGVEGSGCSSECKFAGIAVASIQVSYSKLLDEVPGFIGVSCNDLGIGGAHVVLSGPKGADEVWTGCMQSKMFANVPPGTYQATITLLDTKMNPLTNAVSTAMTEVQKGPISSLNINFHQADFVKQDYIGNLDWNPSWGAAGKKCADAGVNQEQVLLVDKGGAQVKTPSTTSDGIKINSGFGTCFARDATTLFQRIGPLPWGHYTLTLVGKGPMGAMFCKPFPLFVAPGVAPMTYELAVDAFDPSGDAGACP
jgi:cysteine-rich repeat protein